jgi:hypothetical protein
MKCEICRKTVGETFLKKPIGAYVKDNGGKLHLVCFECQKQLRTKEEILKKLA